MGAEQKRSDDSGSEHDGPTRLDTRPSSNVAHNSGTLTEAGVYDIIGEIGSGGGGTVYRGLHRPSGNEVAVKVLRRDLVYDTRLVTRFAREVRAVNMIRHPHIVEVFDFGELPDGRPYYGMELLAGTDLRSLIDKRGRIPPDEVLPILEPVCEAVGAAHEAGVIHRDLKARNIMIDEIEGQRFVKLLDFGIAKLMTPEPDEKGLTRAGTLLGTPVAMAPEQIRGETIDHRIDVYALGVLLYQMLTGSFPYYSDHEPELFRMHLEDPAPRPSALAPVSTAYDAIVARALAKQPENRYQQTAEMLAALRTASAAPAPSPPSLDTCRALGICVHATFVDPEASADEDALDDVLNAQDIADEVLRESGFAVALTTSTTVLGVRTIVEGSDLVEACQLATDVGERINDELSDREEPDDRVSIRVAVHFGSGTCKPGSTTEIGGGEILDLSSWLPTNGDDALVLTPALTDQL